MGDLLTILQVWFVASIPAALFVGAVLRGADRHGLDEGQ